MAEQFLTLMADLDDNSQAILSEWYNNLCQAGFKGTQTPGLPFHISMATYALENEREAIEHTKEIAERFYQLSVHISHIGIFAPGNVLFGGPERNAELDLLHNACTMNIDSERLWTPHVTILIDEPSTICEALPYLLKSFHPFIGSLTKLQLCAFWPMREIITVELNKGR